MKICKTKAVIFDFDGTLTFGDYDNIYKEIYQELGFSTGKRSKYQKDYLDFMNHKISYEEWVYENETDFKRRNLTEEKLKKLVCKINLIEGAVETFDILKNNGVKLYILSGNFVNVIKSVLGNLSDCFEEISANEIIFDDRGKVSKLIATKFDFEGKPEFVKKIKDKLNIDNNSIVFIGNGENDIFAHKANVKTICINPKNADENNQNIWNAKIEDVKNLLEILDYIV